MCLACCALQHVTSNARAHAGVTSALHDAGGIQGHGAIHTPTPAEAICGHQSDPESTTKNWGIGTNPTPAFFEPAPRSRDGRSRATPSKRPIVQPIICAIAAPCHGTRATRGLRRVHPAATSSAPFAAQSAAGRLHLNQAWNVVRRPRSTGRREW